MNVGTNFIGRRRLISAGVPAPGGVLVVDGQAAAVAGAVPALPLAPHVRLHSGAGAVKVAETALEGNCGGRDIVVELRQSTQRSSTVLDSAVRTCGSNSRMAPAEEARAKTAKATSRRRLMRTMFLSRLSSKCRLKFSSESKLKDGGRSPASMLVDNVGVCEFLIESFSKLLYIVLSQPAYNKKPGHIL